MSTPILGMIDWAAAQASPWIGHNMALRTLEQGAGWFRFIDRDLTAPPGSPAEGDCYLVAAGATGAWAGHDGEIAFLMGGGWTFIEPLEGMGAGVLDENVAIAFLGGAWVELATAAATTVSVTTQTGTTYTFDLDDADSVVEFDNGSAITVTIPPNSSVAFPIGTFIELHQIDAGTVTVSPDTGVNLLSRASMVDLAGQEAVAGIRKVATDTWRLTGDIA
jgi:hypothetical protein